NSDLDEVSESSASTSMKSPAIEANNLCLSRLFAFFIRLYSQIVHSERNLPKSPIVMMASGAPNKAKMT
ncbi:hypothetical protein PFISCL1PPCAC_4509, partial [Pristionchus fissidentatus]